MKKILVILIIVILAGMGVWKLTSAKIAHLGGGESTGTYADIPSEKYAGTEIKITPYTDVSGSASNNETDGYILMIIGDGYLRDNKIEEILTRKETNKYLQASTTPESAGKWKIDAYCDSNDEAEIRLLVVNLTTKAKKQLILTTKCNTIW